MSELLTKDETTRGEEAMRPWAAWARRSENLLPPVKQPDFPKRGALEARREELLAAAQRLPAKVRDLVDGTGDDCDPHAFKRRWYSDCQAWLRETRKAVRSAVAKAKQEAATAKCKHDEASQAAVESLERVGVDFEAARVDPATRQRILDSVPDVRKAKDARDTTKRLATRLSTLDGRLKAAAESIAERRARQASGLV